MNVERLEAAEPILTTAEFQHFLEDNEFVHRAKGTFFSEVLQKFLYRKQKALFTDRRIAEQALATCRLFTERGVFHPDTTWAMTRRESGNFQVYALAPKLSQAKEDFSDPRWETDPIKKYELLLSRMQPVDADDEEWILDNLDQKEITARQNWGYDAELDEFYVTDVEAAMFNGDDEQFADNQAAIDHEFSLVDTSIQKL